MRNYVSCPECGFILTALENNGLEGGIPFDCPRCQAHYTHDDFWGEQHEKWDRTMKEAE